VVLPANGMARRYLISAESLAAALRPFRNLWRHTLDEEGKIGCSELKEWRAAQRAAARSSPARPRRRRGDSR